MGVSLAKGIDIDGMYLPSCTPPFVFISTMSYTFNWCPLLYFMYQRRKMLYMQGMLEEQAVDKKWESQKT